MPSRIALRIRSYTLQSHFEMPESRGLFNSLTWGEIADVDGGFVRERETTVGRGHGSKFVAVDVKAQCGVDRRVMKAGAHMFSRE